MIDIQAMPLEVRKIAVLIPKYGLTGGAEGFAAELSERIARNPRYDIHVFANRWIRSGDHITFHKVPLITFPRFLTTISFAWFARRRMSSMHFDLLHAQDRIFAADIFTMHGIPHRLWTREIRKKPLSLFDRATARVEKSLVEGGSCRYFLAASHLARIKFLQEYPVDPSRVRVISPGVDAQRFGKLDRRRCRAERRKALGIGADETVILFVSMNFPLKGLDLLITVLSQLKSAKPERACRLLVVGKGNIRKYRALAGRLDVGERITFAGVMGRDDLDRTYLASDIFSILSDFDTFGLAVLEAMAASLPVVISGNVGAKDIVREGIDGFIVEDTSDITGITGKITLLLDPGKRKTMGDNARRRAAAHTWEAVAGRVTDLYEEILQSRVSSKMPQP